MRKMIAQRVDAKRHALLLSCASVAIATVALVPQRAEAQAFQGNPTYDSGQINIDRLTPGVDTITVSAPTATIDWSPYDVEGSGNINFLPSGNTATFQGSSNYTVLNRVVPSSLSRAIELNGAIESIVGTNPGGNIWFYSPGGIVVGASATFDVGGLLLTSLEPTSWSASGGTFAAGDTTPGPISILDGAKINALQSGSYVALIGPRIEQGGEVRVDGSAAYVAANSLTMTMNQGLFDIQVGLGTDDPNGIVHTGNTLGGTTDALSNAHNVYMVAVPKNQALTMLLGGTIGFDAGVAGYDNGQIVLSSGWNINDIDGDVPHDPTGHIEFDSSIDVGSLGATSFESDVYAIAVGDITVGAMSGDVSFAGDLDLSSFYAPGTGDIRLKAEGGHTLSIGGDLTTWSYLNSTAREVSISADGGDVLINGSATLYASPGADGAAGSAKISASGGSVTIGGAAEVYAESINGDRGSASISAVGAGSIVHIMGAATIGASGWDGQGGDVSVIANGGEVSVDGTIHGYADGSYSSAASSDSWAGDGHGGTVNVGAFNDGLLTTGGLDLTATGHGQDGYGHGTTSSEVSSGAGSGYGGQIYVDAASAGSIVVNGNVFADAGATGGDLLGGNSWAGDAYGGTIDITTGDPWSNTGNGDIHVTGNVTAQGNATGGSVTGGPAGAGGYASANEVLVYSWGSGTIQLDGSVNLAANATGGDGQVGGNAFGGEAGIGAIVGTVTVGGVATLSATGTGGNASVGYGGDGGYGEGGMAWIEADAEPGNIEIPTTFGTVTGASAALDVSGTGGTGGAGDGVDIAAGSGGDGYGGAYCGTDCPQEGAFALAQLGGASLTLGEVTLTSNGTGGAGGVGGEGQDGGVGGEGYGGTVQAGDFDPNELGDNSASVEFGGLWLYANGIGGDGGDAGAGGLASGDGGDAYGGAAFFNARGTATARAIRMFASSIGGDGNYGGDATDGYVRFHALGGSEVTITNGLALGIDYLTESGDPDGGAIGGVGVVQGGNATGATAELTIDSEATVSAKWAQVMAVAFGGDSNAGTGGLAQGGTASVSLAGDLTLANGALVYADAVGGDSASGAGGSATAGDASLTVDGGSLTVQNTNPEVFNYLVVTADAFTGTGVTSGLATGGNATFTMTANGGEVSTDSFELHSWGNYSGGNTTIGLAGDGQGGTASFDVASVLNPDATAVINFANAYISTDGSGGSTTAASTGTGGETTINFGAANTNITGTLTATANGIGGAGATPGVGIGGDVEVTIDPAGSLNLANAVLSAQGTGGSVVVNGDISTSANLDVTSGGDFTIGNATVGGEADFFADGTAYFGGTIAAPTITVTSSDIDIAEGTSLGVSGVTDLLTLNALSTGGPVIIGDTDGFEVSTEGLYHIGDEGGDIHSNVLVINAGDSDVVVYNANIPGSQTEGGGTTSLTVDSDGSVLVLGSVLVTDAGADDTLTINAGDRIELNTDTGMIQMTDSGGDYAGTLNLNANNVWAADGALLAQLEEDVNFVGRDEALATNNGAVVMDGYLRASGINAEIVDTMFVQNTGTPDDFAGITVGDGGLSITSVEPAAFAAAAAVNAEATGASLDLFGHQLLSDGTIVGGDDFAGVVELTGPIAPGSTINGVEVPIVPTPPPVVPPPVVPPPVVPPPVVPPPVVPPPVVPPPVVPPPVVPPPVVPPPVVPPPVVPPPVVPPPVVPPPVVPPQVGGSENVLGPIGMEDPLGLGWSDDPGDQGDEQGDDENEDDKGKGKKSNVNAGLGLINSSPVELDLPIDDPVTSGSDGLSGN